MPSPFPTANARHSKLLAAILLHAACLLYPSHAQPPAAAAPAPATQPAQPPQEYELRLYNAAFRGDTPAEGSAHALILLARQNDQWLTPWGTVRDLNSGVHDGRLEQTTLSETAFNTTLHMNYLPDERGPGGRATYHIKLTRSNTPDALPIYRGSYTGSFRGLPISADAELHTKPPHRPLPDAFTPPRPGQHPRILFQDNDLPEIRRRAQTPLGKAALEKLSGPVALGIRYQLSQDKAHALAAIPLIDKLIQQGHLSDQYGNNVGDRLEQIALTYDLCYHAWPEDVRLRVREFMLWAGEVINATRRDMNRGINWHICSNWSSPLYTGMAFAGLALWADQGPLPLPPLRSDNADPIPPLQAASLPQNTPVADLVSGQMPLDWIYAGPFHFPQHLCPLNAAGLQPHVQPALGTAITVEGTTHAFKPLSKEKDKGYYPQIDPNAGPDQPVHIDPTNAVGRAYFSHSYYYTLLRNDRQRWVQLHTDHPHVRAYLNGKLILPGDVALIQPGNYPLLLAVYIDWTNPWGRHLLRPRLTELPAEQALAIKQAADTEHAARQLDWNLTRDRWNQSNRQCPRAERLFQQSRHMMMRFAREAVGDGGFQAEVTHYSAIATLPPSRYATAHRTMFGFDVSPHPDFTHILSRQILSTLFLPPDKPHQPARTITQEINGKSELNPAFFAALFPIVPDQHKPAVLWAWHALLGVDSPEDLPKLAQADPLRVLLYYPLDLQPKHPRDIMPNHWAAPDFGFYLLRSGWDGRDEFITQVFLKAHWIGGWNAPNAGTFRVLGLGQIWADGSTNRNRSRAEESVVQLLNDEQDAQLGASAILTHLHHDPRHNTMSLTMSLDDLYARRATDPQQNTIRPYSRYGHIRNPHAFQPSGISASRSIAVDYSGQSGAPCLIVLVDNIQGPGKRLWTWQLPHPPKPTKARPATPSDTAHTTTEPGRFTLRRPNGTTLRATFITPTTSLAAEQRIATMTGGGGSTRGKPLEHPIHALFAEADQSFFTIITIQPGEPPELHIEGEGLNAVVRVGSRTIRYHGQNIVLE